ncbi:MAG: polyprenyl synthetase family protein [Actinobacteria bacterium]|nr:polyprenyl synthetase family protein [Actinomycetota bacterium]
MGSLYPISNRIRKDLKKIEEYLKESVASDSFLLNETSLETLRAGGKRLRPALVLISGSIGAYDIDKLIPAAVSVELIHTATLVHDDVLDGASLRRGFPTINTSHGRSAAISTGDFIFGKALAYLAKYDDPRVMEAMVPTTLALSVGEIQQIKTAYSINQTIDDYLTKIKNKTASLFSTCCKLGSLVSGAKEEEIEMLGLYGENLGMAFQVYDDVLDVSGKESSTGKSIGTDLRDGTLTLPVFFAMDESSQRDRLRKLVGNKNISYEEAKEALEIINDTEALERTKNFARLCVEKSIEAVKNINNKELFNDLEKIGKFVIDRYN